MPEPTTPLIERPWEDVARMLDVDAALEMVLSAFSPLPPEKVPLLEAGRQHDAEMRHGNVVGVDFVLMTNARAFRREMRDDLMTVQIEIDPLIRASAFRAAQNAAVKSARFFQIFYGKCQMK